jgi:hypothetical protein
MEEELPVAMIPAQVRIETIATEGIANSRQRIKKKKKNVETEQLD